jgi:hypothetical protein
VLQKKEAAQGGNPRGPKLTAKKKENDSDPISANRKDTSSMADLKQHVIERKPAPFNPNNKRILELSRLARDQYPDGQGDYILPETPRGQCLAIALITHLSRAGQRDSRWLYKFCADRAPWLDPDDIDITTLQPDKAQTLGNTLRLTAEHRERLHITSIAPCDQTPEQRRATRKEQRRRRERERRRLKRLERTGMTRLAWLAAHRLSQDRPWETEGVSRRTWYRRHRSEGLSSKTTSPLQQGGRARADQAGTERKRVGTGPVPCKKIVGGHATCATDGRRARSVRMLMPPGAFVVQ